MIVLGITETHCATAAILQDGVYAREYYGVRLEEPARGVGKRARKLGARLGIVDRALGKFEVEDSERRATIIRHLGLGNERIVALDHHACHAAAAYFGSPFGGHEYKVMGLAPYAPARAAERAEAALREVFDLAAGSPARFEWKRRGPRY